LHQIGEVAHGARIGDVAALGDVGHDEMVLHQPGDGFGFAGAHAEARAEAARDGGAGIGMILVAAFRDVVEEDRHVDRVAALDLAHQFMGLGVLRGVHAALDFRKDADGAQEMFVGGVVVIHVELHQRDDATEIGDEAAEHAGLVHPAQRRFGILARGENVEAVLIGDVEEADDVDRIPVEEILLRDREAPVFDIEAANDLLAAHRLHEAADGGLLLFLLILEHGAEDARQVADILGDQEVVLHEAFDRLQAAMRLVAEALCHFGLQVEGDALLGAAGEEVQFAAHRPEKILGLAEGLVFLLREDAGLDEVGGLLDAVNIFRDPEQRVEIAQAALAFLDVGFDQVAAFARTRVALVALGELGLDEFVGRSLHHLGVETLFEIVVKLAVAIDEARFKQRRADGEIGAGEADAIGDGARRVADFQAQIPEHIEHVFDDALAPGGLLVGQQEQEIDVGARRQRAAAIAADSGDGDALGLRRVRGGEGMGGGEAVKLLDDAVLEIAQALGAGAASMRTLLQPFMGSGAALRQRRLQDVDDGALQRLLVAAGTGGRGIEVAADALRVGDFKKARHRAAHGGGSLSGRGRELAAQALSHHPCLAKSLRIFQNHGGFRQILAIFGFHFGGAGGSDPVWQQR